jgi:hypothetical protein
MMPNLYGRFKSHYLIRMTKLTSSLVSIYFIASVFAAQLIIFYGELKGENVNFQFIGEYRGGVK